MQHRRRTITLGIAAWTGALALTPALAGAAPETAVGPEQVHVVAPATPQHWDPLTDDLWDYDGNQLVLTRPGTNPNDGVRRPFEYAIVSKGPELTDVTIDAEVRLDESVTVSNRDVIVVWNYQGPKRFYYAHFSQDNTIYPHNGIFVVDNADRRRIDDQWNGSVGAPPAVTDAEWHDVRVRVRRRQRRDRGVRRRGERAPDDRDGHHLLRRTGRLRLVRQLRPRAALPRGRHGLVTVS